MEQLAANVFWQNTASILVTESNRLYNGHFPTSKRIAKQVSIIQDALNTHVHTLVPSP